MNINHLYIHVPFCNTRCHYCAFYSTIDLTLQAQWLAAIQRHFECFLQDYDIDKLKTIYIGGGSPSSLEPSVLARLLHVFEDYCSDQTEFSIELNPYDISQNLLDTLLDSPVNRISVGIESFNDSVRAAVNRRGTGNEIIRTVQNLRSLNKFIISCDMMYGLPLLTSAIIQEDIKKILELQPDHISYYELFLEDASYLATLIQNNFLNLPSTEENETSWEIIQKALSDSGYNRYEISNWAYNGAYCQHNIQYWEMGSWIGLGPSAVSNFDYHDSYKRLTNIANLEDYLADSSHQAIETVTDKTAVIEYCMMHLRTNNGFVLKDFYSRFNICYHAVPAWLLSQFPTYMRYEQERMTLNTNGMDHLNMIIVQLMDYMEQI